MFIKNFPDYFAGKQPKEGGHRGCSTGGIIPEVGVLVLQSWFWTEDKLQKGRSFNVLLFQPEALVFHGGAQIIQTMFNFSIRSSKKFQGRQPIDSENVH